MKAVAVQKKLPSREKRREALMKKRGVNASVKKTRGTSLEKKKKKKKRLEVYGEES